MPTPAPTTSNPPYSSRRCRPRRVTTVAAPRHQANTRAIACTRHPHALGAVAVRGAGRGPRHGRAGGDAETRARGFQHHLGAAAPRRTNMTPLIRHGVGGHRTARSRAGRSPGEMPACGGRVGVAPQSAGRRAAGRGCTTAPVAARFGRLTANLGSSGTAWPATDVVRQRRRAALGEPC